MLFDTIDSLFENRKYTRLTKVCMFCTTDDMISINMLDVIVTFGSNYNKNNNAAQSNNIKPI